MAAETLSRDRPTTGRKDDEERLERLLVGGGIARRRRLRRLLLARLLQERRGEGDDDDIDEEDTSAVGASLASLGAPLLGDPGKVGLQEVRAVHFFGTKNAGGVYPDRRGAIIWETRMENAGVGWVAAIIIGGLAGWLAEKFMKSEMGIFMNIVLGIVGAAIASAILGWLGITLGGWIGYLIAGFVGACLLIGIVRAFKKA